MKPGTLVVLLLVGQVAASAACPDSKWQVYTDHVYRVTVCIPPEWKQSEVDKAAPSFEGPDGSSFQLDAAEGNTPQLVCEGTSTHPLRPFGDHPTVRMLKIGGQRACLVLRSKDEGGGRPHADGEIIVKYPRPIKIVMFVDQPAPVKSFEGMYGELVLYGDEKHIVEIAKTLRFQALQ